MLQVLDQHVSLIDQIAQLFVSLRGREIDDERFLAAILDLVEGKRRND